MAEQRDAIRKFGCTLVGNSRIFCVPLFELFKKQLNMYMNQKMLAAILLLALPCIGMHAQQPLTRYNLQPRSGDRLVKQQIAYKNQGRSGQNVLWNLGEVDVLNWRYRLNYVSVHSHPQGVTGVEHGTRYYYAEHGDTLVLEGMENNGMRIRYDDVPAELPFPLQYGAELKGDYHGRGVYCDKAPYREYGRYHVTADATGTLILPSGDTLRNVVRVHSVRKTCTRFYVADSLNTMQALPIFTRDSVACALAADSAMVSTDIYRWYAPGYRYPVLETVTVGAKDAKRLTAAFLLTPEEQTTAISDAVNEPLRHAHSLAGGGNNVGFSYNVIRYDGDASLRLEYSLDGDAIVGYQLTTVGGAVVWQQSASLHSAGAYSIEVPLTSVHQGVCLLSFRRPIALLKY